MAKKKEVEEMQICTCCGKSMRKAQHFYLSYSPIYQNNDNRMTMCKECVLLFYDRFVDQYGDERKALFRLTLLLDVYFDEKMLESCYAQAKKQNTSIAKLYFQKINSMPQFRGKTSFDSVYVDLTSDFKQEERIEEKPTKKNVDGIEFEEGAEEVLLITAEMLKRWGKGLPKDDYIFLEDRYQQLANTYECKTPAQRWLYEQIAKTYLESEQARRNKSPQYEKLVGTISKLMQDSNIKPVQEANSGDDEAFLVGTWAKRIEEKEPIPLPLKQFVDVDKIKYYIETWFVKTFARVLDLGKTDEEAEVMESDS